MSSATYVLSSCTNWNKGHEDLRVPPYVKDGFRSMRGIPIIVEAVYE